MFEPEELIKQAIERHKDHVAVACSFGKDSVAVTHMALKYKADIPIIFCNTGVEFPETIKYKNELRELWNLNLIETFPIKTFWQCIEEYGFPTMRNKGNSRVPKCCIYCKEKPALQIYKDNNINAVITGISGTESRQRSLLIKRYDNSELYLDGVKVCGQRYYAKQTGIWKYHPLAYWEQDQVWDYFKIHEILINPVYLKWNGIYKRCGCLPCPSYKDWENKLPVTHPSLYLKLIKLREQYG